MVHATFRSAVSGEVILSHNLEHVPQTGNTVTFKMSNGVRLGVDNRNGVERFAVGNIDLTFEFGVSDTPKTSAVIWLTPRP